MSNELYRLTATEAARQIAAGSLKPAELMEACLERIAEPGAGDPGLCPSRPGRGARPPRRGPAVLHGIPVGVKDVLDTADMPSAVRLADLGGMAAAGRLGAGGLGARGRRRGDRQDRHDRVRDPQARPHRQSGQSGAYAGRLIVGLGSGRGGSDVSGGVRHADRRQRHPPGGVLRRGRLQADLRHDQPDRHEADVRQPGHRGRAGALGRRLRVLRRSGGRPRSRRSGRASRAARRGSAFASRRHGIWRRRKPQALLATRRRRRWRAPAPRSQARELPDAVRRA